MQSAYGLLSRAPLETEISKTWAYAGVGKSICTV
jgi:hypothetical protein